jgi:hypothetical protein
MVTIPFTEETFRPLCVPGNDTAENPVEFDLSAVGGDNKARLKSILMATSGLTAEQREWTPQVQDSVIAAFRTGGPVFADAVSAVRGLNAPVALAVKVGLLQEIPKGLDRQSLFPITTGYQFSRVCGYYPVLALELAMEITRISKQAEIDTRFFSSLSPSPTTPATPRGTAARATRKRSGCATADSKTKTADHPPAT